MYKLYEDVKQLELQHEAFKKLFFIDKTKPLSNTQFVNYKKYLQLLDLNRAWGSCPFPNECNKYNECILPDGCNADVCGNGTAYRMS
jgi:hypothetical protein